MPVHAPRPPEQRWRELSSAAGDGSLSVALLRERKESGRMPGECTRVGRSSVSRLSRSLPDDSLGMTYVSQIPVDATARVVRRHARGMPELIEYYLHSEKVGERAFEEGGSRVWERPFWNGVLQGMVYEWSDNKLVLATPHERGLPHGEARQWDLLGNLLGRYHVENGTGYLPWWQVDNEGRYLAEISRIVCGELEGFLWWINSDQRSVSLERHFIEGLESGIERCWNGVQLVEGPVFHVEGKCVSPETYLEASFEQATLPRYREQDNYPGRDFPDAVRAFMRIGRPLATSGGDE